MKQIKLANHFFCFKSNKKNSLNAEIIEEFAENEKEFFKKKLMLTTIETLQKEIQAQSEIIYNLKFKISISQDREKICAKKNDEITCDLKAAKKTADKLNALTKTKLKKITYPIIVLLQFMTIIYLLPSVSIDYSKLKLIYIVNLTLGLSICFGVVFLIWVLIVKQEQQY